MCSDIKIKQSTPSTTPNTQRCNWDNTSKHNKLFECVSSIKSSKIMITFLTLWEYPGNGLVPVPSGELRVTSFWCDRVWPIPSNPSNLISPAWLELSSWLRSFTTPGDSASGVSNVPSESELWEKQRETLTKHYSQKRKITRWQERGQRLYLISN